MQKLLSAVWPFVQKLFKSFIEKEVSSVVMNILADKDWRKKHEELLNEMEQGSITDEQRSVLAARLRDHLNGL